ncbi:hypothetical protein [Tsukamurella paurometabola]|nr:hypothetical protein [Tsukamurella paurometabola]
MTPTAAFAAPAVPPAHNRSSALVLLDSVVAGVLWMVLLTGGGICAFFSLFFGMNLNGCQANRDCPQWDQVLRATWTVWGGVTLALVVALIGTIVCAVRRRYVSYWPLIGMVIVAGAMYLGVYLADQAGGL